MGIRSNLIIAAWIFLVAVPPVWAETIRVGWSGPLSGNSAVLGIDSVQAARMAIDEVNEQNASNGPQFELLVEDDKYDTAQALMAYSKLVSGGATALIASTYGGVFASANNAVRDNVIVINPLDCNNDIARLPENTFCIATESESIGRIISKDITDNNQQPMAVLYDEKNPFMVLVQDVLRKEQRHAVPAQFFAVEQSSADFRSILTKLRHNRARSIVFLGHDPMGQAMRETRALGLDAQFYTVGTITSPGFQKLAGSSAEGAKVAYWEAPRGPDYNDFLTRFIARVGRPPILELATVPTYDSMKLVLAALSHCRAEAADARAACVRRDLLAVQNYRGLSGSISMDSDGAVRSIRERLYLFHAGKLSPQ